MSKKRKKSGRPSGGRYTPPLGHARGQLAGLSGGGLPVGWLDLEDPGDDPSTPVTMNFEGEVGRLVMPLALVEWLVEEDLASEFAEFWIEGQRAQIHGDAFARFIEDREVPQVVAEGVAGFGAAMDAR